MTDQNFYQNAKFRDDVPAKADELANKTHQRVADVLVDIIKTYPGGKAIGLEGSWGSGKSTVIEFLRDKFEILNKDNRPKRKIFIFDTWAHQSDPMRRVFLEELIETLSGEVIDRKKWGEKLNALQSKKKRTVETRAEQLSWVATWALITIPFYPFAFALLTALMKDGPPPALTVPLLGTFTSGWLMTAVFAVIAPPYLAAVWTWWRWRTFHLSRPLIRVPKDKEGKSIIFGFNKQTDHVTTDQLIREDEATSVEFNKEFDELASDISDRNFQLIIVLDNLDRLGSDQIKEIWGSMRNFFSATPGSSRSSALKDVWLIVPIDRQHIEAVFSDEKLPHKTIASDGDTEIVASGIQEDGDAKGFIEKTFAFMLRVPPPLQSSWRSFLTAQLNDSFGSKISNSTIYSIFRFLELFVGARSIIVTPRLLKNYVNQIVAQARLSGNAVPLEYQALYVLYKDSISQNLGRLQDSSILDKAVGASIIDPDWAKYLAAAHFNVEPQLALELLLGQEIENALISSDAKRLQDLSKTVGFDSIVHNVVSEKAASTWAATPTLFFDVAAQLSLLTAPLSLTGQAMWNDMAKACLSIEKKLPASDDTPAGINAVIHNCNSYYLERVANKIREALSISGGDPTSEGWEKFGQRWAAAVAALYTSLRSLPEGANIVKKIGKVLAGEPIPFTFEIAKEVSKNKIDWDIVEIFGSKDDLGKAISAIVNVQEPPHDTEAIISVLLRQPTSVPWKLIIGTIQARLASNNPSSSASVAARLESLLRQISEKVEPDQPVLKDLANSGALYGLVSLARRDKRNDILATLILDLAIFKGPDLRGPVEVPNYGNLTDVQNFLGDFQSNPKDEELLIALCDEAISRKSLSTIYDYAIQNGGEREIYRKLFKAMIERNAEGREVILWSSMGSFEKLLPILNDKAGEYFNGLKSSTIVDELRNGDWKKVQSSFLTEAKKQDWKQLPELFTVLHAKLKALTTDEWIAAIEKEGDELRISLTLLEIGDGAHVGIEFLDALKTSAQKIVDGAKGPKKYRADWYKLPKMLSPAQQSMFYRSLRDQLVEKTPAAVSIRTIFDLYGDYFANGAEFVERDNYVVSKIIEPLLLEKKDENIVCLEKYGASLAEAVQNSKGDREVLAQRLKGLLVKADEPTSNRLKGLALKLGLSPEDIEPTQESPDEKPTPT